MTVINTNIASLNAQMSLNRARTDAETAMERLSSGQRINSAADDAAGLSIAARMTSQITGIKSAIKNANDGISLADTAEGALDEVTNMLQRMRELSVQAANDTNTAADRSASQAEIDALSTEIDRVAKTTKFNDQVLLNNASGDLVVKLQVGASTEAEATIEISIGDMTAAGLGVLGGASGDIAVDSNTNAVSSIGKIDLAIEAVNVQRSGLGAVRNRLDHAVNNLASIATNTAAARSRITDADYSEEASEMTKNQILNQASTAMLAQANKISQSVLSLLQ